MCIEILIQLIQLIQLFSNIRGLRIIYFHRLATCCISKPVYMTLLLIAFELLILGTSNFAFMEIGALNDFSHYISRLIVRL